MRALASILAVGVTLASSTAHGQSVDRASAAAGERARAIFRSALQFGGDWLGPLRAAAPEPIVADMPFRGLSLLPRDRSLERAAIAAAMRQFWLHSPTPLTPFEEALSAYTSIRAIHELLATRNFVTVRFFGGLLPFPVRSLSLSPPVADPRPRVIRFDEVPMAEGVVRTVQGLQTIERFVGWPVMAQALASARASAAERIDDTLLAQTLSTVRGADTSRLVRESLRPDAVFDYAIESVRASLSAQGGYESAVTIVRRGSGILALTADEDPEPGMPLLVRFADGRELREWFDGAAPATTMIYSSTTPVTYAAVDPDRLLVLDADRSNNSSSSTRRLEPLAVRLALQWMSWLQLTMLTYTALA